MHESYSFSEEDVVQVREEVIPDNFAICDGLEDVTFRHPASSGNLLSTPSDPADIGAR